VIRPIFRPRSRTSCATRARLVPMAWRSKTCPRTWKLTGRPSATACCRGPTARSRCGWSRYQRERDKRLLKLIRSFLTAGVLENGLVSRNEEGTPQGGPLSPLLSNLMLDVLDRELESRKLHFVRYADDCNIYVRSLRAGERVMEGLTAFLKRKLKLTVNPEKSAVGKPSKRKFLGFSFSVRLGADTSASAKPLPCCADWNSGHADGFASSPGNNGKPDDVASPNSRLQARPRPSPLRRRDQAWRPGVSADPCKSTSRSTTPPSPISDSHPSSNRSRPLKPPNRRVRTRMHGGVGGGTPRGAPYPDRIPESSNSYTHH